MAELIVEPAPRRERGGGGRRPEVKLLLAGAVLTSLFVVQAPSASAAIFTGTPPTVDGRIDPVYGQAGAAQISYDASGDNLGTIEGRLFVLETATDYYVAFQQPFSAKSNAYCDQANAHPDCYQKFDSLVGSDYLSVGFDLDGDGDDQGDTDLYLSTDILTGDKDTGGFAGTAYIGESKGLICPALGELDLDQPNLAAIEGYSAMHYNWNVVGWHDEANSPNFTGQQAQFPNYVYPSTAEWKVNKAACGLADNLPLADPAVAVGDAHNSPQAPFDVAPEFISCPSAAGGRTVNVGEPVSLVVLVESQAANGAVAPSPNRPVGFFVESGPGTIEAVNGTAGTTGTTDAQGQATATARASTAGTTVVRGFLDLDSDGTWDAAVEPVTDPPCPFEAVTTPEAPEITVDVVKTNDADGDGVFNDAEEADAAGAAVPFRAVITNTSAVAVSVTDLTDVYPGQAAFDVCANLIGTVLDPGESVTCDFTVQAYAPSAGDGLTDTVAVTVVDVNNPDRTASDEDTSVVTTPEIPGITVEVVKTNDADGDGTYTDVETAPAAGAAVPFRAVITNTSDIPVEITSLTDAFPGETAFGVCAGLLGTVLDPGESVTCDFTVQDYAPPAGQSLVDTVRVDVVDVDNPDNTATDSDDSTVNTVAVLPQIDLAIDKDDAGATFRVGETGSYTLVVTNVGGAPTTGPVTVTDTLPNGLTFNAASGTNWSCTNSGQVITCTYTAGALVPGQVAPTITVTVNVGAAAIPQVINPARVSTPDDINPNNDTDEEPTPVIQVFGNPPIIRQTPTPPAALVRTGTEAKPLAGAGAVLVLFGAVLLLAATRRRRDGETIDLGFLEAYVPASPVPVPLRAAMPAAVEPTTFEPAPAGTSFLPAPARPADRGPAGWAAWVTPLVRSVRASWAAATEGGRPAWLRRPTGGWQGMSFMPAPATGGSTPRRWA